MFRSETKKVEKIHCAFDGTRQCEKYMTCTQIIENDQDMTNISCFLGPLSVSHTLACAMLHLKRCERLREEEEEEGWSIQLQVENFCLLTPNMVSSPLHFSLELNFIF